MFIIIISKKLKINPDNVATVLISESYLIIFFQ